MDTSEALAVMDALSMIGINSITKEVEKGDTDQENLNKMRSAHCTAKQVLFALVEDKSNISTVIAANDQVAEKAILPG